MQTIRLTWYVGDFEAYLATRFEPGATYRTVMRGHFPAMSVVEVRRLVEPEALVETEATLCCRKTSRCSGRVKMGYVGAAVRQLIDAHRDLS